MLKEWVESKMTKLGFRHDHEYLEESTASTSNSSQEETCRRPSSEPPVPSDSHDQRCKENHHRHRRNNHHGKKHRNRCEVRDDYVMTISEKAEMRKKLALRIEELQKYDKAAERTQDTCGICLTRVGCVKPYPCKHSDICQTCATQMIADYLDSSGVLCPICFCRIIKFDKIKMKKKEDGSQTATSWFPVQQRKPQPFQTDDCNNEYDSTESSSSFT